ncbi:MAG TPA: hypothetical protein VKF36_04775 [Syntrophorhabdales bacterium]|nr:hypothetical protein [Syntrophorhabdales bacterium]
MPRYQILLDSTEGNVTIEIETNAVGKGIQASVDKDNEKKDAAA